MQMRRMHALDGLRALAFFLVYLAHTLKLPGAWMGVDIFFVLSGYLITGVLFDYKKYPVGKAMRYFWIRRASRIIPPYLVSIFFGYLFFCSVRFLELASLLTFTFNYYSIANVGNEIFTPLWSLSVEHWFYVLWPIVIFLQISIIRIVFFLIVTCAVFRYFTGITFQNFYAVYEATHCRLDAIALGGLLYVVAGRSDEGRGSSLLAILIGGLSFLVLGFLFFQVGGPASRNAVFNVFGYLLISIFSFCLILIIIRSNDNLLGKKISSLLSIKPLVFLGEISYGCYVYHMAVIVAINHLFDNYLIVFFCAYPILIVISYFSYEKIEKPIMKWAHQKTM